MQDGEDDGPSLSTAAPLLFKKRGKGAAGTLASAASRRPVAVQSSDEEEEKEGQSVLRRSTAGRGRGRGLHAVIGGRQAQRSDVRPTQLQLPTRANHDNHSDAPSLASESLLRNAQSDATSDTIPSEAFIQVAKEKRRRAMNDDKQASSGEEDFAEFTGATERIALEEDAIERETANERERRREAVEREEEEEESDDSGKEWEEAQLNRMQYTTTAERKHSSKREQSPFRPAPIPLAAPLPQLSSISVRLEQRQTELREAIKAQQQLQDDATHKLAQLHKDEERNKGGTESAAEREAWFREFEQFIVSMALFLEEKIPLLEEVESDWAGHLAARSKLLQKARVDALADWLALFYGVPARSLLPQHEEDDQDALPLPIEDGPANSYTRGMRRQFAGPALDGLLAPADQAAFAVAQRDIIRRSTALLDDVQAAEYREPAARIPRPTDDGAATMTMLHPASLVARFHRWRRTFPDEYANAWGGLTLASVWDFWIRRTLCGWDGLQLATQDVRALADFGWYVELAHYAAKAATTTTTAKQDMPMLVDGEEGGTHAPVVGGDDEVVAHALTNTVVPTMINVCRRGAFDPWSVQHNSAAREILEEMSYVLEKDDVRFQSLVAAFLHAFQPHVEALAEALSIPPASPPPEQASEAGPAALQACVQYVVQTLLRNLVAWHRFVLATHRPTLIETTNTLLQRVVVPLLVMTRHTVGGAHLVSTLANDVLTRTTRPGLLGDDVRLQLEGFVSTKM